MKKQDGAAFLKSELASVRFGFKGQYAEASRAIEPILIAFETLDTSALPTRIGKSFRKQLIDEIKRLQRCGLKRVIRITSPQFISKQSKNALGFARSVDASREWRECELVANVLERYIDIASGECVIEHYDESATITLRQSRRIKAGDQVKAKNSKSDIYTREQYNCPSCGALLTHIADNTSCPYCGAVIRFNFFDWQLDSFYLDMRKSVLTEGAKKAAAETAVGIARVLGGITSLLAAAWDSRDSENHVTGYNNSLGAWLTVFLSVAALIVLGVVAMPWYAQLALGALTAALITYGIIRAVKRSAQDRRKRKIVRYSDPYLRNCVYNILQERMQSDKLLDFSVDSIVLDAVENTESTTSIRVTATVIQHILSTVRRIELTSQEVPMKLSRARYPERIKSKGRVMEERECPSCGANFESDQKGCCAYCGYGLRMENYVWRQIE